MDFYLVVARVLLMLLTLPLRSSLPLELAHRNYHPSRNFPQPDLVATQNWSVRLPTSVHTYLRYPPHHGIPLKRQGVYARHHPLPKGIESDTQVSEELAPWDQLDVIVLIGRRRERKRRIKKQRVIKPKPIYTRRILGPHGAPTFKGRTPTTDSPINLHTLAGPPYHHEILPNASLLVIEDEIPSNLQVLLPGHATSSSANLKTTIAQDQNRATRKQHNFTDPSTTLRYSLTPPSPKTQVKGKMIRSEEEVKPNKFTEDPAYTFGLEDAVSRDYPPRYDKSLSSSLFARRRSQDGSGSPKDASFLATLGYPNNSWLRINRKVLS